MISWRANNFESEFNYLKACNKFHPDEKNRLLPGTQFLNRADGLYLKMQF
jgi:hypothetical protein